MFLANTIIYLEKNKTDRQAGSESHVLLLFTENTQFSKIKLILNGHIIFLTENKAHAGKKMQKIIIRFKKKKILSLNDQYRDMK